MSTDPFVELTNKFYLEMSKQILTIKEYEILYKTLIDKMPKNELAELYQVSAERIRQIYFQAYQKVKIITETLREIDYYKQQRNRLRQDYQQECQALGLNSRLYSDPLLDQQLVATRFPLSKRMRNMFRTLEVQTVRDLTNIPLYDLHLYRGFKVECKRELKAFIEFENLECLFDGFHHW